MTGYFSDTAARWDKQQKNKNELKNSHKRPWMMDTPTIHGLDSLLRHYGVMKACVHSGWAGLVPASTCACQASSVRRADERTVNS